MNKRLHIALKTGLITLPLLFAFAGTQQASAGNRGGLNPDNLSFFEEPLAFNLFGFTVNYNQLVDVPLVYDTRSKDGEFHPRTSLRGSIERQLPNALTIGAVYAASYDDKEIDKYNDRWAIYGRGVWGKLSGGKVNDTVRAATRRWRGTGNAELEFDDLRGALGEDKLGAAYQLRLSAYTLNVGVDKNGNADIGVTYERPNKSVDVRVTGRYTNARFNAPDGVTKFDTNAVGVVGRVPLSPIAL